MEKKKPSCFLSKFRYFLMLVTAIEAKKGRL